jgi:hypothetical protein
MRPEKISKIGWKYLLLTYGVLPISKPICPVIRIATNHSDESVGDESQHKEYLEDGHIKLSSPKIPDCKPVEPTTTFRLVLPVTMSTRIGQGTHA